MSIAAAVTGRALLLGQPKLFGYAALGAIPVAAFVMFYEEPTLTDKFGAEYEECKRNVPRWPADNSVVAGPRMLRRGGH